MYNIRIKCGNCIEVMKRIPDKTYDLCLTDPPYNVGKEYGSLVNDNIIYEEYKQFSIDWFTEVKRISKGLLFTPGFKNMKMWCNEIEYPKHIVCWYKGNKFHGAQTTVGGIEKWEPILAYGEIKMSIDAYNIIIRHIDTNHPVPKPVELFESILSHTKNIKSVIDPFIGSGTTAIACMKLGIDCDGIEINADYVTETKRRLHTTKGNQFKFF